MSHPHEDLMIPPVQFEAAGDSPEIKQSNLDAVLPSPGFPTAAILIADAITKRAEIVVLDFTKQNVSVRYQVDGLWYSMPPMDRASGDYMLATLKKLAGMNYQERRSRQKGQFKADYLKFNHKCTIISQGVPTGERVAIQIEGRKPPLESLEDLGMRPRMREDLVETINRKKGLILVSAMPHDGLTTTWRGLLGSADRFLRDYYVMEEKSRQEPEVINVTPVVYDGSAGQTPLSPLPKLMLREPDAIAFAEVPDAKTFNGMTDLVLDHEKMVVTRINAKHAIDAILRVLLLKPNVERFAAALSGVLSQRLVRKLCTKCRIPIRPSEKLLQQLGIPAGRIDRLYRNYSPTREDLVDQKGNPIELEPCVNCGGPGFVERTAIFEYLQITDELRQAIVKTPQMAKLTEIARRAGHVSLRDEGIVVVARGVTSLEELQRVLNK